MITSEQILELAEEYMDVFPDDFIVTKEQLIKFAQRIYEDGYDDGCYQATNSTGYTGLFGEPQ